MSAKVVMPCTVYFDLHRMLRRLEPDDLAKLQREFGPRGAASASPERVSALRAMMPSLIKRVLSRGEQPIADDLIRVVGLAPTRDVIRPLLAVLMLAPELWVRTETVEDVLVSIGAEAVEPLMDSLTGLATFPRTPLRVIASLSRALARIGDPRASDAILACLRAGAHGQWELLEALHDLSRRVGDRAEGAIAFVSCRASNRQHMIEKGLWPRYGRRGISPLRVRLLRARYARVLRRWQSTDSMS